MDRLHAVYERLKDRFDLTLTTTAALNEGFTVDCPIIVGKAHGYVLELYLDGDLFVLSVMNEAQTKGTHWHPNHVDCAVNDITAFMEGTIDCSLQPFPNID